MRGLVVLVAMLTLLAGCERTPVVVGSKDTVQDRILAEMMAGAIEAEGLRVELRTGLGDSADLFQALRAGDVDLYPEYSGTALALLGSPPADDRTAVFSRLEGPFAALGLEFLKPLGFESRYTLVTRRGLAQAEGIATIRDLARRSEKLRLGVSRAYAERPQDGLSAFLERFGLDFRDVVIVPEHRRTDLYGRLVEERVDVVIGFSTDPQIADFGLVAVGVDQPFFPAYDAAPLTTTAALERHPQLGPALDRLAGQLDAAGLRDLVRQVQVGGRTPRAVARIALARIGLLDQPDSLPDLPLTIAIEPREIGSRTANRTLNAVRTAMPGRAVSLAPDTTPLGAVASGKSRLAVVPGAAHFRLTADGVVRDESVEAIGAVGPSLLYAIAGTDGPSRLGRASRVATGPVGSPGHLIASVLARHGTAEIALVPQSGSGAAVIGDAIGRGEAEAGLVIATRQRSDVVELLVSRPELRLVDADKWWQGPVRLALPFLGEATLRPDRHPGLERTVSVLSMQTVLTGPAPAEDEVLGRQGPVSFRTEPAPLTDATVRAIDAALGTRPDVDASLRAAAALSPGPAPQSSARNPRPDQAVLSAAIFAYLAFAGWLLVRRRPAGR